MSDSEDESEQTCTLPGNTSTGNDKNTAKSKLTNLLSICWKLYRLFFVFCIKNFDLVKTALNSCTYKTCVVN